MNDFNLSKAKKETGFSYLGRINASSKLKKNEVINHNHTYCLYLAPANESGYNVCQFSTPECRLGCLATSGRAGMELKSGATRIKNSRINKTKMFYEKPNFFMKWLITEISKAKLNAENLGYDFSVRLNGTSDIDWQNVYYDGKNIFQIFSDVDFYDYTKNPAKFLDLPENYHLTFSYSGRNKEICEKLLSKGFNIAVVFNVKRNHNLPKTFLNHEVIDGDISDLRSKDKKGVIVGLRWKHISDKDNETKILNSVFVVNPANINVQNKELTRVQ